MANKTYRAGIIPYIIKDGVIQMMFMTPSDPKWGGSLPQLAKGKIEGGEQPLQAALREGEEELGLKRDNIAHIHTLGVFLGRTYVYLAKVKNPNNFNPSTFETQRVDWMTNDEFEMCGRKIHKPIVRAAINFLEGV